MGDPQNAAGERLEEALLLAGLGALYNTTATEFEKLKEAGRAVAGGAFDPVEALASAYGVQSSETFMGVADGAVAQLPESDATVGALFAQIEALAARARAGADDGPPRDAIAEMIEAMLPDLTLPSPAAVLQARRNSAARLALANEHGFLTSGDIADLNDSSAQNRAALANRWKREGRVFAVEQRGSDLFPAFQLDERGRPREVMARVLAALGGARGWETALWFTAANAYLDGERPVDLLDEAPERLIAAAEREAAEVYF